MKEERMEKKLIQTTCRDCGILMPPDTGTCPGCGFDNAQEQLISPKSNPRPVHTWTEHNIPSQNPGF